MKSTLIAAACLLLLAGCGSSAAAKSAAPKTFTAAGTLTLQLGAYMNEDDVNCTGLEGYDDIKTFAQVVVYDATGKAVGLSQLGYGKLVGPDRDVLGTTVHGDHCTFDFSVPGVPAGAGPYMVEVSHRGKIAFTEASAGSIALTLGS